MTYDQQILKIFSDVGERGISARLLARHVYNQNRTFFSAPELDEVYTYVRQFIAKHSRSAKPLLERTGRWGYYKLNSRNVDARRQMLLGFTDSAEKSEDSEERPQQDFSLSLFD